MKKFAGIKKNAYLCTRKNKKVHFRCFCTQVSGCSSVRLEYASGGRGVASSNLVIPTTEQADNRKVIGFVLLYATFSRMVSTILFYVLYLYKYDK